MAKLTPSQIKGLAQDAGFSATDAVTMTAIALAESGGDSQDHNGLPPDDSYGLWQINMFGSLGPARLKEFNITSATQLFDPITNAVAAHKIYSTSGFKAWSTYNSGKYKLYMNKARTATPISQETQGAGDWLKDLAVAPINPGGLISDLITSGSSVSDSVSSVGSAAMNIANDIAKTATWISKPSNWLRILYVAGGAAALLFAMQSLFKPVATAAVRNAVKTASDVVPEAKAATKVASVVKTASTPPRPVASPAKASPKPTVRSASSASHAKAIRVSGYEGPIRHDY